MGHTQLVPTSCRACDNPHVSVDLEPARQDTLRSLSDAYARGLVTTATLEQRVSEALRAHDDDGLATCLWDLPRPAPWWRRHGAALRHRPRLLLVEDEDELLRFELPPAPALVVIGRHSGCDVRVENTSVSRRHAAISLRGGICRVRDLGSMNGTTLNGRPIDVADIQSRDCLMLGEVAIG
jgi:hypothetical protein